MAEISVLRSAAKALESTTYAFKLTNGWETTTGEVDPATGSGRRERVIAAPGGDEARDGAVVVGDQHWIMIFGGEGYHEPLTGRWFHLDPAKVAVLAAGDAGGQQDLFLTGANDPARSAHLLSTVINVRHVDDHYVGLLDLSADEPDLGVLAAQVPFEAWIDSQGRLTSLTWGPGPKAIAEPEDSLTFARRTVTYSRFGEPVRTTPPPGAVEAVPLVYEYVDLIS